MVMSVYLIFLYVLAGWKRGTRSLFGSEEDCARGKPIINRRQCDYRGVETNYVSAIVAAYRRVDQTLRTIEILQQCDPPPGEIFVHVDGNQVGTAARDH